MTRAHALLLIAAIALITQNAHALVIQFDRGFNTDAFVSGFIIEPPNNDGPTPPTINLDAWDDISGLGDVTMTFNTPATHYAGMYIDHIIGDNPFDENADTIGAPSPGQNFAIDNPLFSSIAFDLAAGAPAASQLSGTNNVPVGSLGDPAMAIDWSFPLAPDQTAVVTFLTRTDDPEHNLFAATTDVTSLPFHLRQTDATTGHSVYFGAKLDITDTPTTTTTTTTTTTGGDPIPEPTTATLTAIATCLLLSQTQRRKHN